jgi:hypothetical protein
MTLALEVKFSNYIKKKALVERRPRHTRLLVKINNKNIRDLHQLQTTY